MKVNNQGYSLIELMVSIFLISGVALLISQFSTSYNSSTSNYRRVCESYTESLVSLVKEETPYLAILDFPSNPNIPSGRTAPNFSISTKALGATQYRNGPIDSYLINKAPLEAPISTPGLGTRLQSFQLIQGSVRTLAEMYNRGLGCNFSNYAPLAPSPTGAGLPIPVEFSKIPGGGNVLVDFRIEPFSLSTGNLLCARTQVFPAPRGIPGTHSNVFEEGSGVPSGAYLTAHQNRDETGAFSVTNMSIAASEMSHRVSSGGGLIGDPDLGLKFSVRMRYTLDGQQYNCVTTQDFSYPPDASAPPVPAIARAAVATNQTTPAAPANLNIWNICGVAAFPTSAAATIEAGYSSTQTRENGTQLLCRDLSFIKVAPAMATRYCFNQTGGSGYPGYYTNFRHGAVDLDVTFGRTNAQYPGFTSNTALRSPGWVPCDTLVQCGQSPNTRNQILTSGSHYWSLRYNTLPLGCHLDFEVVGVDTAGNRSSAAAPAFINKSSSENFRAVTGLGGASVAHNVRGTEIYSPVCGQANSTQYRSGYGTFCAPQADWAIRVPVVANYANGWMSVTGVSTGYYTCRTTCCENAPYSNTCRPWPQ